MSQILKKVQDVDPNNSEAVKEVLSLFFQNLSKQADVDCNKWLRTLESVVNRYPKYCMTHRSAVETYLAHFLDSHSYYNVVCAAKCAHALQQVRPPNEKTASPKSCWREFMTALCDAAHALLKTAFNTLIDIYKNHDNQKEENESMNSFYKVLSSITNVKMINQRKEYADHKRNVLFTRIRNIFVFIQAMLVDIYPVAKPIRPQLVLDVILQAMSLSNSVSTRALFEDLVTVKVEALRTVDALIACLGPNLIPYSSLIIRITTQTLRWTSENRQHGTSSVRVSAYNHLSSWLQAAHAWSPPARLADDLLDNIARDVTPVTHPLTLTMNNRPTKNLSKKAKRKLANTMLQESSIATHMPGEKNRVAESTETTDEVSIAALEFAETFLNVCGIFLKPAAYKRLLELIVRECYNIDVYSRERGVRLLRALEACRRCAPSTAPPPTQHCLHLYSVLANSRSREISKFCSEAIQNIRLHLHCSPPSLNFALEVAQNDVEDKRNRISEKNRATLEALLGADKMPNNMNGEVINIADEPASKKPRLDEDIQDKISLSSESVSSVEISDDNSNIDADEPQDVEIIEEEDIQTPELIEKEKTAAENKADNVEHDVPSIFEARTQQLHISEAETQLPSHTLNDTVDGEESRHSLEVCYDYPNTGKETVTVLEKMDDENLPSTNDTDDIHISCGQALRESQESISEKLKTTEEVVNEEIPAVNGVSNNVENEEKIAKNGEPNENAEVISKNTENIVNVKTVSEVVSVEDMLADFVDEFVDTEA